MQKLLGGSSVPRPNSFCFIFLIAIPLHLLCSCKEPELGPSSFKRGTSRLALKSRNPDIKLKPACGIESYIPIQTYISTPLNILKMNEFNKIGSASLLNNTSFIFNSFKRQGKKLGRRGGGESENFALLTSAKTTVKNVLCFHRSLFLLGTSY